MSLVAAGVRCDTHDSVGTPRRLSGCFATLRDVAATRDACVQAAALRTVVNAAGFVVNNLATVPIAGQKPGTSGLRKQTKVFMGGLYLHNFVQSTFDSLPAAELRGSTLVVSGDGRYGRRVLRSAAAACCRRTLARVSMWRVTACY